ncbi:lactonase family protein [Burkholderia gladioli]|uniref:lactonase family protein n=1 Tax=Burkholderia gladioli TaxID=28095 RepID=UPI0015E757F1|nr:beta-propeller fold lactonase family protein [Burkholderia gladioli]MBA1364554.1 lactonase family protein [Burkholderia gladioli]
MSKTLTVIVSNSISADLRIYRLDPDAPSMQAAGHHPLGPQLMPLAIASDRSTLFAALRSTPPAIARCRLDPGTGQLATDYRLDVGAGHVSLAIDRAGRFLFGASYGSHQLVVHAIARLDEGDASPLQTLEGIRNAHAVLVSPDDRHVYVTSLGSDALLCCSLDAEREAPLEIVDTLTFDKGFGPRHMRFSPDGAWLHVLSEFRATVAVFRRDPLTGRLSRHHVTTRPPELAAMRDGQARPPATEPQPDPATLAGAIWAADLQVRPDGRFVYLSERTTSRLFVLRVEADGTLAHAGAVSTETQPRGFAIDPGGRYLVACGEHSPQVSLYLIDAASGLPALHSRHPGGQGANWVEIVASGA